MGAVHFYHLTSTPLERALPKLLERCYGGGFRTVVLADEARVEKLNELLWAYDPNSFLPHGSEKDGNPELQPIFITSSPPALPSFSPPTLPSFSPPRTSHSSPPRLRGGRGGDAILLITNGLLAENPAPYDRVIDMFDGSDSESLNAARARWTQYKDSGCALHYYQQTNSGSWDKKAV